MNDQVYYFKSIGNIAFVKSDRAKSLRITIKPKTGVKVTVPKYVSLSNAFRFVEEKTDWIRKSIEKVKDIERKVNHFKPGSEFKTRCHKLEFYQLPESKLIAKVGNGMIRVFYDHENQICPQKNGFTFPVRCLPAGGARPRRHRHEFVACRLD